MTVKCRLEDRDGKIIEEKIIEIEGFMSFSENPWKDKAHIVATFIGIQHHTVTYKLDPVPDADAHGLLADAEKAIESLLKDGPMCITNATGVLSRIRAAKGKEMANALHGELREPRIFEDDGA